MVFHRGCFQPLFVGTLFYGHCIWEGTTANPPPRIRFCVHLLLSHYFYQLLAYAAFFVPEAVRHVRRAKPAGRGSGHCDRGTGAGTAFFSAKPHGQPIPGHSLQLS